MHGFKGKYSALSIIMHQHFRQTQTECDICLNIKYSYFIKQ
uniref:Uncharacterized protein n=1 Tax=Anguilla anguilla TaxID=7936 RepID=A0A0E9P7B5_ANGAN